MSGRGIIDNGFVMYGVPPIEPAPWLPTTPDPFPTWPDPLTPPEQKEAARIISKFQADPEIGALATVLGALAGLDDPARERVIAYVVAKWGKP